MAKNRTKVRNPQSDIKTWIAGRSKEERPKLRSALTQLRKEFAARDSKDLLCWYRIGCLVAEFFPEGSREYGSSVTELLAAALGAEEGAGTRSVSNTLWQARTVAEVFPTTTAARAWAKKRHGVGRRLSAYHVFAVAAIDGAEQQHELLERCLTEGWSVKHLRAEVQRIFGGRRSKGGRPAGKRATPHPAVALKEIQVAAAHWMADYKVWFNGRKSALGHVAKMQQTEQLREELELAIEALNEMQATMNTGLECLQRLVKEMRASQKTD